MATVGQTTSSLVTPQTSVSATPIQLPGSSASPAQGTVSNCDYRYTANGVVIIIILFIIIPSIHGIILTSAGYAFQPETFPYTILKWALGLSWCVGVIGTSMWWSKNEKLRLQYRLNRVCNAPIISSRVSTYR